MARALFTTRRQPQVLRKHRHQRERDSELLCAASPASVKWPLSLLLSSPRVIFTAPSYRYIITRRPTKPQRLLRHEHVCACAAVRTYVSTQRLSSDADESLSSRTSLLCLSVDCARELRSASVSVGG